MLLILDLDNTIFDTASLKNDLAKSLIKFGVSENLFFRIYQKIRKEHPYSHEVYLKFLSEEKNIEKRKAKIQLERLDRRLTKYLYPDAVWFLKKMKKKNARLVLLSYGDKEFQKTKIEKTKIGSFFDKVIVTNKKNKVPFVAKLIKNSNKKVFFINDDPKEISQVSEKFKNIIPINVKGGNLKKVEKWIR